MNTELLSNISTKKQKLENLRTHLKDKFFGIDYEIDKIVDSIKTWYVMPNIITHPIIVNLWSLTGNGKTDLVRTIVDFLEFNNSFCEIQLADTADDSKKKISDVVLNSGCKENKPGIILLDEFQRYRTIDSTGQDVKGLPYQDIWLLLSDGKFPAKSNKDEKFRTFKRVLASEWREVSYSNPLDKTEKGEEVLCSEWEQHDDFFMKKGRRINRTVLCVDRTNDKDFDNYDDSIIDSIVEFLDYTVPFSTISNMSYLATWKMIQEYYNNKRSTYDFTKCLIFVAGNLDEAFQVANGVDDCDTDADVFHEYTKKVSIIEIKKALTTRFKPEQISRLGNNHVIYPSLNADSYRKIIQRTCENYIKKAEQISNIHFTLKDTVVNEIYENAVYPTQGTRPVFSSIHMMFSSPLSSGILWALENNHKYVDIEVFAETSCMTFSASFNSEDKTCVPIQFQLRDRKNRNSDNFNSMVAVHEVGHAILYSALFRDAPRDIKINVASFDGGYNQYDFKYSSATDILNIICVGYGGIVAEELIFGKENRASGSVSDISKNTKLAVSLVREHSMSDFEGFILTESNAISSWYLSNAEDTNAIIEQILSKQRNRAMKLMKKHKSFLISCSKDLLNKKKFNKQQWLEYAKDEFDFSKECNTSSDKVDTNVQYHQILMNQ